MNKVIKQQLDKVSVANLSNFNEDTNTYFIPRFKQIKVEENSYYIIKLDPSLLNSECNTLLVINWNKGSVPTHLFYKAEISKVLGKMIKINGLGYDYTTNTDLNDVWSGWLPLEQIEFISQL